MLVILNLNQMLNIGVTIPRCAPGYFVIDELQEEHADMSEMEDGKTRRPDAGHQDGEGRGTCLLWCSIPLCEVHIL